MYENKKADTETGGRIFFGQCSYSEKSEQKGLPAVTDVILLKFQKNLISVIAACHPINKKMIWKDR